MGNVELKLKDTINDNDIYDIYIDNVYAGGLEANYDPRINSFYIENIKKSNSYKAGHLLEDVVDYLYNDKGYDLGCLPLEKYRSYYEELGFTPFIYNDNDVYYHKIHKEDNMEIDEFLNEVKKILNEDILNSEQLKQIMYAIEEQKLYWRGKPFREDMFKPKHIILEAGRMDEEPNTCALELLIKDNFLIVQFLAKDKATIANDFSINVEQRFDLSEFSFSQLKKNVIKYIKDFVNTNNKIFDEDVKIHEKRMKVISKIKNTLSKSKDNILDTNIKYGEKVKRYIDNWSFSDKPKITVNFPQLILPTKKSEYVISAVYLTESLKIGVIYSMGSYDILLHDSIAKLHAKEQDKLTLCNEILEILQTKITSGKSNLHQEENKLLKKKEATKKVAEEFRNLLQSRGRGSIGSIESTVNGYSIFTEYWGDRNMASKVCDEMQDKYPDFNFDAYISEKGMITFEVTYQ